MKQESGQTLVLSCLLLTAMLSLMAVLIDGGNLYVQKRNLQAATDAGALAGARELASSQTLAAESARSYVEVQNHVEAYVDSVVTSTRTIEVTTHLQPSGFFMGLLGYDPTTLHATATASLETPKSVGAMLPVALMRDSYTLGQPIGLRSTETCVSCSTHTGVILPPAGSSCAPTSGSSDYTNLLRGSAQGGIDACAVDPGDALIPIKSGSMAGPTTQGLDARLSTNTQSMTDVFSLIGGGVYQVKDPTSPRIGIIPIVEAQDGTTIWPLLGSANVRVKYYILAYLGNPNLSGNPAYGENGKEIWVVPVRAVLPASWPASSSTFTSSIPQDAAVRIRLTA